MARDEAEEEREFLSDLKIRSGMDLAGWMEAIGEQGFSDKNEVIDWLRAQGFPFARASWLERIHSNGGRPIYLDDGTRSRPPRPAAPPQPTLVTAAPTPPPAPVAQEDTARLEALIAAAKGYRPLYVMLEGAIRQAVADVTFVPKAHYISVCAPIEFAAIAPAASEIRLGLALGDRPHDANLGPSRIRGPDSTITHMLVLKDARQINPETRALITAAHAQANSQGR